MHYITEKNACQLFFAKISGLYTLQVRLLGGEAQTERFSATYDIFIDGSSFTFPSLCDIKINIPFDVKWSFYKFGISSKISLTGYETLFDNGSDANIEIEEISNGEFKVTLKDYGSYILLIEAKKNDGTVLSQKRIKVNKFYAPKMTMDDSNIDPRRPEGSDMLRHIKNSFAQDYSINAWWVKTGGEKE